ncbi:hypothetical protein E7V31_06815 [Salmonella enterica]|nr:hypothetical protein [Salmonella enterica]
MNSNMIFAISALVTTAVGILFIWYYLLKDMGQSLWQYRYEKIIKKGIKNGTLLNDDIYTLADRWGIDRVNISRSLGYIFSNYMDADNPDEHQLSRLREIMAWHKEQDPYADLPENITLQLQAIKKLHNNSEEEIHQLSVSLSELYISKEKGVRLEKLISRISLFVGILGTGYTIIYQYIQ